MKDSTAKVMSGTIATQVKSTEKPMESGLRRPRRFTSAICELLPVIVVYDLRPLRTHWLTSMMPTPMRIRMSAMR